MRWDRLEPDDTAREIWSYQMTNNFTRAMRLSRLDLKAAQPANANAQQSSHRLPLDYAPAT
jgi:hypothetical protein